MIRRSLFLAFTICTAITAGCSSAHEGHDRRGTGTLSGDEGTPGDGAGASGASPGDAPVGRDPNGDEPVSDDGGNSAACATGFEPESAEDEARCRSTFGGKCFESDAEACACAGCALDQCRVAESFPTQVSCAVRAGCEAGFVAGTPGETRVCNVVTENLCFEETEAACLCRCGVRDCAVAESYPMQVTCN